MEFLGNSFSFNKAGKSNLMGWWCSREMLSPLIDELCSPSPAGFLSFICNFIEFKYKLSKYFNFDIFHNLFFRFYDNCSSKTSGHQMQSQPSKKRLETEIFRVLSKKHGLKINREASAFLVSFFNQFQVDQENLQENLDFIAKEWIHEHSTAFISSASH